jgi:hypothetical protein
MQTLVVIFILASGVLLITYRARRSIRRRSVPNFDHYSKVAPVSFADSRWMTAISRSRRTAKPASVLGLEALKQGFIACEGSGNCTDSRSCRSRALRSRRPKDEYFGRVLVGVTILGPGALAR